MNLAPLKVDGRRSSARCCHSNARVRFLRGFGAARPGGTRRRLMLWRSSLRSGSPALLARGSRAAHSLASLSACKRWTRPCLERSRRTARYGPAAPGQDAAGLRQAQAGPLAACVRAQPLARCRTRRRTGTAAPARPGLGAAQGFVCRNSARVPARRWARPGRASSTPRSAGPGRFRRAAGAAVARTGGAPSGVARSAASEGEFSRGHLPGPSTTGESARSADRPAKRHGPARRPCRADLGMGCGIAGRAALGRKPSLPAPAHLMGRRQRETPCGHCDDTAGRRRVHGTVGLTLASRYARLCLARPAPPASLRSRCSDAADCAAIRRRQPARAQGIPALVKRSDALSSDSSSIVFDLKQLHDRRPRERPHCEDYICLVFRFGTNDQGEHS